MCFLLFPTRIVGNKNDDGSQPEVLEELAQDLAEENRLYLYQTSARDNMNVSEVFQELAAMMVADRKKAQEPDESTKLCERSIDSAYDVRKVLLTSDRQTPKKSCCAYFESPDTKAHVV
ncbi:unnamed protein product [Larinioides sclopetarius]|uniref:Uncharacterized protein n=1 Tax=Larinioides sclopetarius TaxID=280406 RepID=A0AAV2AC42_9ARAC